MGLAMFELPLGSGHPGLASGASLLSQSRHLTINFTDRFRQSSNLFSVLSWRGRSARWSQLNGAIVVDAGRSGFIAAVGMHCVLSVGLAPIWRTAVRTGRLLKGGGRSYYFPSKYYTFTVYDREINPIAYWSGVIGGAVMFLTFLAMSISLTVGLLDLL
jgi:hypothetical protein